MNELAARAAAVRQSPAEADVPSPCVSVCRMDAASRLCTGCLRTLDEIAAWGGLPDAARREVWQRIAQRATLQPPSTGPLP